MNAIEELVEEHEAVKTTLKILERICDEIARTGSISRPNHVEQLLNFFKVFVDQCHHGKEEELLFPALEEVGVSREGGPIGVMLAEHQKGRDLVKKMEAALSRFTDGNAGAASQLKENADEYITLLNYHIEKENNVLFPMAGKNISKDKLSELKNGFDKIESDRIGVGKHEAFHMMIDELKAAYLKKSSTSSMAFNTEEGCRDEECIGKI